MTTSAAPPGNASDERQRMRGDKARERFSGGAGVWIFKIAALAVVDALMVFIALAYYSHGSTTIAAVALLIGIVVTFVYLPANKWLPAKYLTPGLILLLVFSVFAMLYTVYIAFTNYGDGHNGSKADAVAAIMTNNQDRVQGSPAYPTAVGERDGKLWLIVVNPKKSNEVEYGTTGTPLQKLDGAEVNSLGAVKSAPGFSILQFAQISQRAKDVSALQVPMTDNVADGFLKTTTGSVSYEYNSTMTYDAAKDTFTAKNGTVYHDSGNGSFVDPKGNEIQPGWKINVGFRNFERAFTNTDIRGPLLQVTLWTFAFAFLSVLTTFALGLFLAIIFNDPRMRGQKFYRVAMILPYAFPGFLSSLIWAGLFNQEFGFVNTILLHGANIPWLTDPWWGKISILIVNLWLGFPYMFLLSTGALQSIPEELTEAAVVDGASGWKIFRYIKLPLLLVPLAPLLISSFAFNFNNFVLIYMLTQGGPQFPNTSLNVGSTDILISLVYKVAFGGAGRDYGLASAFAILVFVIVGAVSYIGFRQTKALEDLS